MGCTSSKAAPPVSDNHVSDAPKIPVNVDSGAPNKISEPIISSDPKAELDVKEIGKNESITLEEGKSFILSN